MLIKISIMKQYSLLMVGRFSLKKSIYGFKRPELETLISQRKKEGEIMYSDTKFIFK